MHQLCRACVPAKRIAARHIQIGQPLVLKQQKQESLTCYIRFYLTVRNDDAESVKNRIVDICTEAKNILEIMNELGYKDKKTVRKYLDPLVKQGRIAMTIPDKPTSRNQKYITIK